MGADETSCHATSGGRHPGRTQGRAGSDHDLRRSPVPARLRRGRVARRRRRLERVADGGLRSMGEQGYVLDKAQWLGKFAEFSYLSLESNDVKICCYRHAAIVRCVQRSHSTWRGQEMALTVRVSQTWVELPEGWRLAGIQFQLSRRCLKSCPVGRPRRPP
ncbi:DUF4440 domain-containing protein [Micromonospora sp. URMC 103]|uniref:DUF4440 domain-containing protein n=1 Tax=Micromonospora sp. URMC 103 TaxID=3423406 RepID=UPI003F1AD335